MYNNYGNYIPYQTTPYNSGVVTPTPQKMEVIKVNGKNGAEAFILAPNSSVLLLDTTSPIVWLKTTDGAGYPTITPYNITPYKEEPKVDTKSLEERITRLEGIINESYINANNNSNNATTTPSNETNYGNDKKRK